MNLGTEKNSIQAYFNMYNTKLPEFSKMCVVEGLLGFRIEAQNCGDVWEAVKKWPQKIQKKLNERLKIIEKLGGKTPFKKDHIDEEYKSKLSVLEELLALSNLLRLGYLSENEEPTLEKMDQIAASYEPENIKINSIYTKPKGLDLIVGVVIKNFHKIGLIGSSGFGNPLMSPDNAKNLLLLLPSSKELFKECQETKMSLEEILTADDLFDFLEGEKFKDLKEVVDSKDIKNFNGLNNAEKMDKFGDLLLKRGDVLNDFDKAKKALEVYYKHLPELINDVTNVANKDKINKNKEGVQVKPVLSFAYKLLKKYDQKDKENFKVIQECVFEHTKNILETAAIEQTMSDISTFIEKCDNSNLNDILSMISNDTDSKSIIDNIEAALQFLYDNQIINDNPFDRGFNKFSDINVDKWDAFCEAVSFFFKNFFSDFTLWKNCAKASDRLKTSRFINQFHNERVSLNGCGEGIEQQSSVFELLKGMPMLCPKTESIDKQKLDLE